MDAAAQLRSHLTHNNKGITIDHFTDRLLDAADAKGAAICVGIDPVYERLPAELQTTNTKHAQLRIEAISQFVEGVLQAVAPHVPCVKFQSACFERYRWPGIKAYYDLIHQARAMGLIVIGDAKRGDIGISSEHYAAGCLADDPFDDLGQTNGPDALTVNAYLGADGLDPFVQTAVASGKGLFALVRTSNPGGDAIQSLTLADGRQVCDAMASMVAQIGSPAQLVGRRGYSLIGAVVGATKSKDAARLRQLMPQQLLLLPGFGTQGGQTDDVRACFKKDGTGALVTASRSVLYAYEKTPGPWQAATEQAAIEMKQQISVALA